MKKWIFILAGLLGFLVIANIPVCSAAFQYLETLPNFQYVPSPSADLTSYLQWVLAFGISLAGILAVFMIVIGGIEYITAYGNPTRLESAKNRIEQALLGLLLAIGAWLILYTINPNLIKGTLIFP